MTCPGCGFSLGEPAEACPCCGLIFERWRERRGAEEAVAVALAAPVALPRPAESPDPGGAAPVRALAWGVPLGLLLTVLPLLRFIAGYLATLVHELGHAVAAWLFGYPAIPAFDFLYGGGVTIHQGRSAGLLVLIYAGLLAAGWFWRRNRRALVVLAAFTLLHVAIAATAAHEALHLAAGHGAEIVFAVIFLWRGVTGRACHVRLEQPLYVMAGTFLLVHLAVFAGELASSPAARDDYENAKGGGGWMDLSRLAVMTGSDVASLAGLLVVAALAAPLVVWAAVRRSEDVDRALDTLLAR